MNDNKFIIAHVAYVVNMSPSATLNIVLLFPVFSDLGFWGFNRIRKFKQNVESLVFITDFAVISGCLVVGIDVGSEFHYARAFDWRGIEFSRKPFKFSNTEPGFTEFKACSLDLDQPAGFRVLFAGGLFGNHPVLVDVAKVLSDLDQPDLFVAREVGADHLGVSALAVVALAVPAVEGEADALFCLGEVCLEGKPRG